MKSPKRLKRRHKELLKRAGLNCDNWLYVKNPPGELHLVHRLTGRVRILEGIK